MVALGIVELFILMIMLSTLLVVVAAIIDIVRFPASSWKAAGQIQWLWLGIVLFFPVIGSIVYLLTVRRDLARVGASMLAPTA